MSNPVISTKIEAVKPEIKAAAKAVPEVVATKPAVAAPAVPAVVEVKAAVATIAAPAKVEAKGEVIRDRKAVAALVARLRDPEADNARDAAMTLGTLPRDAEAVAALAEAVRNSDGFFHSVVRAAAAQALGKIGDRSAVDALIEATRDSMAEASEEAVKALGLLGDARALPGLEAIVKNADGFYLETVRKSAAEAVARLRQSKAKA